MLEIIKNELIEVYDSERESFHVGYMEFYNEKDFILICIDKFGKYDGKIFFDLNYIYQIKTKTNYLKVIDESIIKKNPPTYRENNYFYFINEIINNKYIAYFSLYNSEDYSIYGQIKKIENNTLKIKNINTENKYDGLSYVDIDAPTKIYANCQESIKIKKILENE